MNNPTTPTAATANELIFSGITMKEANRDFLVRLYPNSKQRSTHKLMSVNSLRNEIGDLYTVKFVEKFIKSGNQKQSFKLRRGIEVVLWAR
tara:strand:+ start:2818 stop:3090 length:273 start_codon:yes stop_codon:yes gene_type:complete